MPPGRVAPYFSSDQYDERVQVASSLPDGAEMHVVAGDTSARRFVMTAEYGGRTTGVLDWRMPKDFAADRRWLATTTT
ncbi:oxidoreductase C-terminal domain-containing protein [Georgenia halophila]